MASRFELDVREPRNFADVSRENGERFLFDLKRSVRSYLRVLRRMPLWTEDFKEAYDELAKKEKEVLFIWGDSDCTVPYQEAEQELRELFGERNTSCCLLRESGHGLLLEVHLPNHSRPSFWAGFSMLSALESHEEPRSLKDFQTFSMDFQVSKAFEGFRRLSKASSHLQDAAEVAYYAVAWFRGLEEPAWRACLERSRLTSAV